MKEVFWSKKKRVVPDSCNGWIQYHALGGERFFFKKTCEVSRIIKIISKNYLFSDVARSFR